MKDIRDHKLDNRMESFFLAETIKYLYLLFDPDNFLHNSGLDFELGTGPSEDCVLGAGGYIFNTEAHPLDPAALHCCSRKQEERRELQDILLNLSEPLASPQDTQSQETDSETEPPVMDQSISPLSEPRSFFVFVNEAEMGSRYSMYDSNRIYRTFELLFSFYP